MSATGTDYLEISEAYAEVRDEISDLFKVGTNKPKVKELLREATYHLDRGDSDRAIYYIEQAQSTARTATRDFINDLIVEVRNILLSTRTVGGDISKARPMLITAKKYLNSMEYRQAASIVLRSIDAIGDLPSDYHKTLKEMMKVLYNFTLLETSGLDMTRAKVPMEMAFGELKNKRYRKALKMADHARSEVRAINKEYKDTSNLMVDAKFAIREAQGSGADVTEAQYTMERALDQFESNNFEMAQDLFRETIDKARQAEESSGGQPTSDDMAEMFYVLKMTASSMGELGSDVSAVQQIEAEVEAALAEGDNRKAMHLLDRMRGELIRISKEIEAQEGARASTDQEDISIVVSRKQSMSKEAIDRSKRMGADVTDAEMHYALGWNKEGDGDMNGALNHYSKALDAAIKAGKAMAWRGEG